MNRLFTSESVTEGHPDKLCDRISDAVLDAMLEKDPLSRVACETFATTGLVVVGGEISTDCYVDIPKLVRDTICEVGYDRPDAGFDGNTCAVLTSIDSQSPDISMGVTGSMEVKTGRTKDKEALLGAGDQGMMFGYACDETADLMPLPITLANELAFQLSRARKSGAIPYILPDGKTQVTVEYGDDGKPLRVDTVVISTQHLPGVETVELSQLLVDHVIAPVWGYHANDGVSFAAHRLLVNPTGRFVKGGPAADTGLTGRKIIVDTYGGYARHGGGAFRQGPDQGGPICCIHGPVHRQECGGRRPGEQVRGPTRLRHRCRKPGLRHGGHLRHRLHQRLQAGGRHPQGVRHEAKGHHRPVQPPAPHLQGHLRIRPLRERHPHLRRKPL